MAASLGRLRTTDLKETVNQKLKLELANSKVVWRGTWKKKEAPLTFLLIPKGLNHYTWNNYPSESAGTQYLLTKKNDD